MNNKFKKLMNYVISNKFRKLMNYVILILAIVFVIEIVFIKKAMDKQKQEAVENEEIEKVIKESNALIGTGERTCGMEAKKKYEELLIKVNNRGDYCEGYVNERLCFLKASFFDTRGAKEHLNKALLIYGKNRDENSKEGIGYTLYYMGMVLTEGFHDEGQRREGVEYLERAGEEFKKFNNLGMQARTLKHLSYAYAWLEEVAPKGGEKEKVFKYGDEALELYEKLGEISEQVDVLNFIGHQLIGNDAEDRKEKAFEYFKRALALSQQASYSKEGRDTQGEPEIAGSIGDYYLSEKRYKEAEEYYQKSFKLYEKVDKYSKAPYCRLYQFYKRLGDKEKMNYWENMIEKVQTAYLEDEAQRKGNCSNTK